MEPRLPGPNFRPEQSPVRYGVDLERTPSSPETNVERSSEQLERRSEAAPSPTPIAPILPPPVIIPQPIAAPINSKVPSPATDGVPLVANDDDLIEKEWVEKAKRIIVETKDDPYMREQEVGKLQADYLRKRYGRELGTSS